MRTFLTYVLAALAAVVVGSLSFALVLAKELSYAAETGDGVIMSIGNAIGVGFGLLVAIPFVMLFLGVVWLVAKRLADWAGFVVDGQRNSWLGAVIGLALTVSMLGSMLLQGPAEFVDGFGFAGIVGLLAFGFFPAFAWGTVFWIRAPKPTTAGIAA